MIILKWDKYVKGIKTKDSQTTLPKVQCVKGILAPKYWSPIIKDLKQVCSIYLCLIYIYMYLKGGRKLH